MDIWLLSCSTARCVLIPHYFIYKKQIKGLELISSVIFAFGIWLKNQNKPTREIAKTLGVAKSTVWYILKRKECTGELSNTKRPRRPRKPVWWMTEESFPWSRRTLHNIWSDPEDSPGGKSQQLREDFTRVNTEDSAQAVNHW